MNVSKEQVDALNAIITITVDKVDYAEKVDKLLYNHRKNANVQGFRKGAVPMSVIQTQFGKPVLLETVNKIVKDALSSYLAKERLNVLGNPIPRPSDDFGFSSQSYDFVFEVGLAPSFEINLDATSAIKKYKIVADEELLTQQIERIQKQYGKIITKDTVEEADDVHGDFTNEEKEINAPASITLDIFKDKATADLFIGKKVGDVVVLSTKGLFEDDHDLMNYLKIGHDEVHGLDIEVKFTITSISNSEPTELNQELFDKLFGEGKISSAEELKAKIKEDAENQFESQSDQKFISDVSEFLLENTKFDLPARFLKRWIQVAGEKPLTEEEAELEYEKSEKGLRYQLIEGKIIQENRLSINFEDLKSFTNNAIRKQMAQFGQIDPSEKDVNDIVARVLSNQDEVKRLSNQVLSEKILEFYKQKVTASSEEVTYQDFIKISYGE